MNDSQVNFEINDLVVAPGQRQRLANLDDAETLRCAQAFGTPLIIHAATRDGSLRQAAAQRGIPTLLYEAGEALRFDQQAIQTGIAGIVRMMSSLDMIPDEVPPPVSAPVTVTQIKWVRTPASGILHTNITLGQQVGKKQILGFVSDAFGEKATKVTAPADGIVIGSTQNPLVNQGDAIFHLATCSNKGLCP